LALEAPDARVMTVDALALARPLFKRAYGEGYLKLVDKAPSLFGMLFDLTDKPSKGKRFGDGLRRAVQRWGANQLAELVETGGWDAVIHTHFLAPELIAALRRRGRVATPQLTVVTDYDAHRIWVHEPTERYCVASPVAAASLRSHGVSGEAIETTGIPVMPSLSVPQFAPAPAPTALLPLMPAAAKAAAPEAQPVRALDGAKTAAAPTPPSVAPPRRRRHAWLRSSAAPSSRRSRATRSR